MAESFFHAGGIHRHRESDGAPGGDSIFVVVHVGQAPQGFADPAEGCLHVDGQPHTTLTAPCGSRKRGPSQTWALAAIT
ncbi:MULTISPECIES: hypothetical protein [Kitasatospora]|uniref:Uncharacterized protein n=1 Tax=Kitasatospora arboriphila TaxID=258052 RepID=A0ABN1TDM6_9ACTN